MPSPHSRLAIWLTFPLGALLSLSFAPYGWWPLAVLCPAYLFFLWREAPPGQAAQSGFLFTAALFLAGTYWLYDTIHVVGHAPAWVALFLMFGMVTVLGSYSAALGYVLVRWVRPLLKAQTNGETLFLLLVIPAAWTVLEWFRGWFLSGFPWFALGYSQTDTWLAGFAPVGGVYAVSLLASFTAAALASLIATFQHWQRGLRPLTTHDSRLTAAIALGITLIWGSGALLRHHAWTQPSGRPLTVAIVQGAVPQDLKWDRAHRDAALALYRRLTLPHMGKDIILWPEAALPDLPENLIGFLGPLWQAARTSGTTLMTGLLHLGSDRDDVRNGLLVLDEQSQWYDKRRLVPFGEFFPVPGFIREWMRLQNVLYSDLTAGAPDQPALQAAGQKVAATICYEDAYGSDQLDLLKEVTLLVNVTNDSWFGDTSAASQHLQISRLRAIEAERPLLRAASDGISALINAEGKVEKVLPRFEPGVLTGVVQPRAGLTPYAHAGNWPVISLCFVVLAACIAIAIGVNKPKAAEVGGG